MNKIVVIDIVGLSASVIGEHTPFLQQHIARRRLTYGQMQAPVSRLWDIDGFPNYFFAEDNELYRITARGEAKQMRRAVKRYTLG